MRYKRRGYRRPGKWKIDSNKKSQSITSRTWCKMKPMKNKDNKPIKNKRVFKIRIFIKRRTRDNQEEKSFNSRKALSDLKLVNTTKVAPI